MHSVRIELAKLILVLIGTRITYQATGDAGMAAHILSNSSYLIYIYT